MAVGHQKAAFNLIKQNIYTHTHPHPQQQNSDETTVLLKTTLKHGSTVFHVTQFLCATSYHTVSQHHKQKTKKESKKRWKVPESHRDRNRQNGQTEMKSTDLGKGVTSLMMFSLTRLMPLTTNAPPTPFHNVQPPW